MEICIRALVALALQLGATYQEIESICKTNPTCRYALREEQTGWQAKDQDKDQRTPSDSRTTGTEYLVPNRCRLHKG